MPRCHIPQHLTSYHGRNSLVQPGEQVWGFRERHYTDRPSPLQRGGLRGVGSRADEVVYSSGPGREGKAALGWTDGMGVTTQTYGLQRVGWMLTSIRVKCSRCGNDPDAALSWCSYSIEKKEAGQSKYLLTGQILKLHRYPRAAHSLLYAIGCGKYRFFRLLFKVDQCTRWKLFTKLLSSPAGMLFYGFSKFWWI